MNTRAHTRHDTVIRTAVLDGETGELLGHLANVSRDGIAIVRRGDLEVGRTYTLALELPCEMGGRTELKFKATVRWSGVDSVGGPTRVGFTILDADESRRRIFEQLEREACFSS
jgi:hypothetical protein